MSAGLSRSISSFVRIVYEEIIYFLLLIKSLIRNSVICMVSFYPTDIDRTVYKINEGMLGTIKNIKVITGVIATLGMFSALLLITEILFYSAVSSDRLNFQNESALSYQQQELTGQQFSDIG